MFYNPARRLRGESGFHPADGQPRDKEHPMARRMSAWYLYPVMAAALCACGQAQTAAPVLPAAAPTETAAAAVTAETAAPTDVIGPAANPTPLPPSAPPAGLVYTAPVAEKTIVGTYLVDPSGQSKLISEKAGAALSPDQTQLVCVENGDLWVQDLTAGTVKNITQTKDRTEDFPQWWPARPGLIVFSVQYVKYPGPGAGYLATIKPDGTNYLPLDEETGSLTPAALSPDGQSIAYDRAGVPWIYNYSAGTMPIFPGTFTQKYSVAVNPAWSPDSRKIAWQLFGLPGEGDGTSAVAILDLDMLTVTLIHQYPIRAGSGIGNRHLAWSPDGNWLAVANQAERAEDGKVSLWVMRPDGSEEHPLGAGDLPIWSPDGTLLLFAGADGVRGARLNEWNPFVVTLPKTATVIGWVKGG
jgi:Tol biopolymer transport system component